MIIAMIMNIFKKIRFNNPKAKGIINTKMNRDALKAVLANNFIEI